MLFSTPKIQHSESQSQPSYNEDWFYSSCSVPQRYNILKANHNAFSFALYPPEVVQYPKDTTFWKPITTERQLKLKQKMLFSTPKIQHSESQSQPWHLRKASLLRCSVPQRYNILKANHNLYWWFILCSCVVQYPKDTTFWKPITTYSSIKAKKRSLFSTPKIQHSESQSQRSSEYCLQPSRCSVPQRYNILKANHNQILGTLQRRYVVGEFSLWWSRSCRSYKDFPQTSRIERVGYCPASGDETKPFGCLYKRKQEATYILHWSLNYSTLEPVWWDFLSINNLHNRRKFLA